MHVCGGSMKISLKAASIEPYTAGEQPRDRQYIKLNTNENPYPPSPACAAALRRFDAEKLKLYPHPKAETLANAIALKEGVEKRCVFVGNGSDEVLALILRAFYDDNAQSVLFPAVTYSFYPVYCNLYSIAYETVPMRPDFTVDVEKLQGGQGVVIANPNAPTSLSLPLRDIETILKQNAGKPVIVDEAYIDFATDTASAASLLKKYENLAVVKTFSKSYSLAGMRCGYMLASPFLVDAAERIKDSFNSYPVDSVCQAVCTEAVRDEAYHKSCVEKVIATRARVIARLRAMGKTVLDSQTNFLFVKGGKADYERLRARGVLVRWFDAPDVREYTRVSVGSDEEMDVYLAALED